MGAANGLHELAQCHELAFRVFEAFEQLDRLVQPGRGAVDHLRLQPGLLGHVPDLVGVDVVGGLVDVVADVVDHARESIHVVAVEGRDERLVEEIDHSVRQPVALVLELANVEQLAPRVGPRVEQLDECPRDLACVR